MRTALGNSKLVFAVGLVLVGVLSLAGLGQAGEFVPSKPIQMIAAAAPGGGSDTMARTMAQIVASEKLAPQPMVVQNIPGGGSAIGTTQVSRMKGDSHALLVFNPASVAGLLVAKGGANVRELTMIAQLALDEQFIVVKSDSPFKSIKDIVDAAKQKENAVSIAGADQADRVCARLLENAAGIKMRFAQFNSGGEAITALLGGHVDMIWANPPEFISQFEAKMVRPIAIAQDARMQQFKDVPTFKEHNLDVVFKFYRGVVAPPGLAPEVVAYYEGLMKKLNDSSAWKERYLAKYMLSPGWQGSQEFTKTIYDSEKVFTETLKSLGLIK